MLWGVKNFKNCKVTPPLQLSTKEYRVLHKLLLLAFKCMKNIGPVYLKELLISKH